MAKCFPKNFLPIFTFQQHNQRIPDDVDGGAENNDGEQQGADGVDDLPGGLNFQKSWDKFYFNFLELK